MLEIGRRIPHKSYAVASLIKLLNPRIDPWYMIERGYGLLFIELSFFIVEDASLLNKDLFFLSIPYLKRDGELPSHIVKSVGLNCKKFFELRSKLFPEIREVGGLQIFQS